MEVASAIVTIFYVSISGIVGVRLMLRARRPDGASLRRLPEFWLGFFFLLYSCVGAAMNVAVYAGWSDPALALPPRVSQLLHAGFFWLGGAGLVGLLVFLRATFRPREPWARALVWGFSGLLLFATVVTGLQEQYRAHVVPQWGYWLQFALRDAVFVWVAIESLRYWTLLRKRLVLGLAEPVLVNRFLLMGVWGAALAILAHADTVCRLLYWSETGSTTEWVPEIGRPILLIGTASATGFLGLAAAAMWLVFFPTRRYASWLERRAAG